MAGLIGGGADFTAASPELANLRQQLIYARQLLGIVDSNAPAHWSRLSHHEIRRLEG